MKTSTIKSLEMYRRVYALLEENASAFGSIEGLGAAKQVLKTKIEELNAALYEQEVKMHAVTLKKNMYLESVQKLTIDVKNAFYLYAKATNNEELLARHKQTAGGIREMHHSKLRLLAEELVNEYNTLQVDLSAYGANATKVQELVTMLESFATMVESPRTAILSRAGETNKIAKLEQEIRTFLREDIDRYMLFIERSHPDLYFAYKLTRKVIGARGKKIDRDDGGPSSPNNDDDNFPIAS